MKFHIRMLDYVGVWILGLAWKSVRHHHLGCGNNETTPGYPQGYPQDIHEQSTGLYMGYAQLMHIDIHRLSTLSDPESIYQQVLLSNCDNTSI